MGSAGEGAGDGAGEGGLEVHLTVTGDTSLPGWSADGAADGEGEVAPAAPPGPGLERGLGRLGRLGRLGAAVGTVAGAWGVPVVL